MNWMFSVTFSSSVEEWKENGLYSQGDLVLYLNSATEELCDLGKIFESLSASILSSAPTSSDGCEDSITVINQQNAWKTISIY